MEKFPFTMIKIFLKYPSLFNQPAGKSDPPAPSLNRGLERDSSSCGSPSASYAFTAEASVKSARGPEIYFLYSIPMRASIHKFFSFHKPITPFLCFPFAFLVSSIAAPIHALFASAAFAIALSIVSPQVIQPGSSGYTCISR